MLLLDCGGDIDVGLAIPKKPADTTGAFSKNFQKCIAGPLQTEYSAYHVITGNRSVHRRRSVTQWASVV